MRYHHLLEEGYDCAFGSRFLPGSVVTDYPRLKLAMNRVVNLGIRVLFRHGYNDTTNAFKAYRREVIDNIQPLLSNHFNLTVELPLKAFIRGHSYAIVPISWRNRAAGESKLGLREMGSRYLFIVLYAFLEHHLSRGDYRRPGFDPRAGRGRAPALASSPPDDRQPPTAGPPSSVADRTRRRHPELERDALAARLPRVDRRADGSRRRRRSWSTTAPPTGRSSFWARPRASGW